MAPGEFLGDGTHRYLLFAQIPAYGLPGEVLRSAAAGIGEIGEGLSGVRVEVKRAVLHVARG